MGARLTALSGVIVAGAWLIATATPPRRVTILAVGDIMLSRNVAAKMKAAKDPLLPFRNVSALLDSSDLNFGNLESPFAPPNAGPAGAAGSDWDGVIGGASLVFAAPNGSVRALSRYNFRIVAMANNHALDQEEAGLAHTLSRLAANRIQVAGAGHNLNEAWQAPIVDVRGYKIAFLAASYASLNFGTDERNEYVARMQDLERLQSRIRALKSQAACIVVAMHAGDEYTATPTMAQVSFAHAAIEAGANVVVGSHPHWLQPFERYKAGMIFYSLGNFVFDLDSSPETREGVAVKLAIDGANAVSAQVIPIEIEDSCCPRLARPDEVSHALRRMRLTSVHIPSAR